MTPTFDESVAALYDAIDRGDIQNMIALSNLCATLAGTDAECTVAHDSANLAQRRILGGNP